MRDRWYLGHQFTGVAQWPGSIEAQMAEAQDLQKQTPSWQDTVVAWYERDFIIPENWCAVPGCPVRDWNAWRQQHPQVGVDLYGADLGKLTEADLSGATLSGAILTEADLSNAELHEADLRGTDLQGTTLSETELTNTKTNRPDEGP